MDGESVIRKGSRRPSRKEQKQKEAGEQKVRGGPIAYCWIKALTIWALIVREGSYQPLKTLPVESAGWAHCLLLDQRPDYLGFDSQPRFLSAIKGTDG